MNDTNAFTNFSAAALRALPYLRERTGLDCWMITRIEGNECIAVDVLDGSCDIQRGQRFRWSDSLCCRMLAGQGPPFAHNAAAVPCYASSPLSQQFQIGAYMGVPLYRPDGTVYGTLCGVSPRPISSDIIDQMPTVELVASLLSNLLCAELSAQEHARRAERAEAELLTDSLTNLFNRRGWDALIAAEESRCRRFGNSACVLSIDLDDLKTVNDSQGHAKGDQLLRAAADVLRLSTRQQDICARVGGDEFAVLAVECDLHGGELLVERLLDAFAQAGVRASIGMAPRSTTGTLQQAWHEADQLMYSHKKRERVT
jgi:diguanylate cyclase (GGDEF)-like protein